jgi:hypothetical protein
VELDLCVGSSEDVFGTPMADFDVNHLCVCRCGFLVGDPAG